MPSYGAVGEHSSCDMCDEKHCTECRTATSSSRNSQLACSTCISWQRILHVQEPIENRGLCSPKVLFHFHFSFPQGTKFPGAVGEICRSKIGHTINVIRRNILIAFFVNWGSWILHPHTMCVHSKWIEWVQRWFIDRNRSCDSTSQYTSESKKTIMQSYCA